MYWVIWKNKILYSSAGYNSANVEIKTNKITASSFDVLIEIERGEKTKIRKINFIGNQSISDRKLRDVVASETQILENTFKNTNFNKSLLDLDTRLLSNFYKSSGFYDVKINSKFAQCYQLEQI